MNFSHAIFIILSCLIVSFCNSEDTTENPDEPTNYRNHSRFSGRPPSNHPRGRFRLNKKTITILESFHLKNDTPVDPVKIRTRVEYLKHRYTHVPFPHDFGRSTLDCFLLMPKKVISGYYMPIPYRTDARTPKIIYPDIHSVINVKQNGFFKLSCPGSHFTSPINSSENEITVKCLRRFLLKYQNRVYNLQNFSCADTPKPTLVSTKRTCKGGNQVYEVGFKTQMFFFKIYRICFDLLRKVPLYSWYVRKKPTYRHRQLPRKDPFFISGASSHFNELDMQKLYYLSNIKNTIEYTLDSKMLTAKYFNQQKRRTIKQRDLTSNFDFNYVFEQESAYFHENSVPQWSFFNFNIWKDVERGFRYDMARGEVYHLVITGTYGTFKMMNTDHEPRELFLDPPDRIPVPLYIWKMDYDFKTGENIVYVGVNDPFTKYNESHRICPPVPCRKSLIVRQDYNRHLLYCCTKESFEKVYGKLDPIVYEKFR